MTPDEKLREIIVKDGCIITSHNECFERVARAFAKWALEREAQFAVEEDLEDFAAQIRRRAAQIGGSDGK